VRIVYLVVSHRNPAQVLRLVAALKEGPAAEVVVRHDERRSQLDPAALERAGGRSLRDGIDVEWGHHSHLRMLLGAIGRVRTELDPDWLVVISGQDYPLRPMAEIEARLAAAGEDAFLGNPWRLQTDSPPAAPADEFFRRYAYWHARVPAVTPRPPRRLQPLAYLRELPSGGKPLLGIRRPRLPFDPANPCWVSADWPLLGRRAIEVLVRAARHDGSLLRHYRHAFAGSESFLATVLMNEPGLTVSGDDRRFVRFAPDAPNPDLLTSADLEQLLESGAHFARKFDAGTDAAVLDALDERRTADPR
jgi:hypothetical protein